ncbi:urease subunit beta [Streptomyces sp. NPDC007861]|uniref:urease subunit beta n=1 Tax=Streptomyces sp. NPDC007861 TaxID=3154893 RepID=UPI0033EF457C
MTIVPRKAPVVVPGEVRIKDRGGHVLYNSEPEPPPALPNGMEWKRKVWVRNDGDRAIQVGSHFHFFEANPGFTDPDPEAPPSSRDVGNRPKGLVIFEYQGKSQVDVSEERKKELTAGYRLDIAPGTALRFEPGEVRKVPLVALAGNGTVTGLSTRGMLYRWRWYPTPAGRNFKVDQTGETPENPDAIEGSA